MLVVDGFTPGDKKANGPPVLVVILHGWRSTPQMMDDVAQASRAALSPGGTDPSGQAITHRVDTYVPTLPHHRTLSTKRAVDIVVDILREIDTLAKQEPAYGRIVLCGHSMGATIARRVFLVAAGKPPGFRTEDELSREPPRAWANKVDRIVLLAAFNRGWQISPRLSWKYSIGLNICGLLGHLSPKRGWVPTIFDIRLGAPFMVQTRMHWLAYRRQCLAAGAANGPQPLPAKTLPEPILIQLIGSRDDLISPFDQVDIAVDGNSSGKRTYYLLQFAKTDHKTAIRFTGSGDDAKVAQDRKALFVRALTGNKTKLKAIASKPALLVDEIDKPDKAVKDTVFVIHGIRDDGFWTHRVAEKVRALTKRPTVFRAWTPTYGYFAMLPFILPWIRRQKVEWFMDQYVSAVAQYPNSKFHYVGHSNGTYLAARGLQDYPACAFGHVFFAGSVVRSDYKWQPLIDKGRVARVLNVVASTDWVVALLPKALQWLPCSDIGGAGFDGFDQADTSPAAETDPAIKIVQRQFVEGCHSAGIAETQWTNIANFIVKGEIPSDHSAGFVEKQPPWLKVSSGTRAAPVLLLAVFVVFIPALICSSEFDGRLTAIALEGEQFVAAFASWLASFGLVPRAAISVISDFCWLSFGGVALTIIWLMSAFLSWLASFGLVEQPGVLLSAVLSWLTSFGCVKKATALLLAFLSSPGAVRTTILFTYGLLVKFVVTRV